MVTSDPAYSVNETVPFYAGVNTVDVYSYVAPISVLKKVKLTVSLDSGTPAYAYLIIMPTPSVKSISFPTSIYGNEQAMGVAYLAANAPLGGAEIAIDLESPGVALPSNLQIREGERSRSFNIFADDVETLTTATISAYAGGQTVTRSIVIKPNDVATVTLSSSSLVGGGETQGTVTLRAVVIRDTEVQLSSPSPFAVVPATVTVLAGAKTATFRVTSKPVTKTTSIKLAASRVGVTRYVYLTVTKG